jgi:hypothetical protein
MLGFLLASATILHTLFSTRVNAIGGLIFFTGLTVAYVLLKRRRQS